MSRLIVKNLPGNVTGEKVKEKFSLKGRVTDVQLKYTPDGKFRKFCFVGYDTPEQAQAAIEYFNNSFFNTSRISVELCRELGDKDKPKSWSKYSADSSAYEKLHKKETEHEQKVIVPEKEKKKKLKIADKELFEKIRKHKDDPAFLEFLECHGENRNTLDLDDDGDHDSDTNKSDEEKEDVTEVKEEKSLAHAPISDMEYLKSKMKSDGSKEQPLDVKSTSETVTERKELKMKLFTVIIRNLPYSAKKKNIKQLFNPLTPASIRFVPKVKGIAYAGFKTEKEMKRALIKHKTFFSGKQILITQHKEKVDNKETENRWKEQNDSLKNEEGIAESGRIFIRNLSYTVTEEELQELFSKYGPVTEVIVPVDKLTRQVKGFGLVTYLMPENALAAYMALDGTILHGRMLHLLPAKPKETEEIENEGGSYKAKKAKQLKENAQSSHTWNTLFLGQDAVANVIAEKYNATKQEVLTGKDAAVRLALGETQIVAETRQFLEDNGVKLDVFNQEVKKRSKTVILVKNLPANTISSEIRDLFAKYGELGRIVLPPSGVTGIVEFLEPSEARRAFTNLAYSKFKHLPLYLEWAPENTFSGVQVKVKEGDDEDTIKEKENIEEKSENKTVESDDENDIQPEPDSTLFVKNLNFETNEESLKKHFSKCGKIASATVAKKKDPANPGKLLSMGYGFVQFYLKSSVNEALKVLQGSELEGHHIELKRSNRTLQTDVVNQRKTTNIKKQTGTKILVRNIPFQATAREIQELFKPFGEIKSVRLPKKMVGTGPHRGFGFVEFLTKHDAKRAMKALCQSTHFFGRRLVLEWAENEEDVDQIRKRTAQLFHSTEPEKRSKKATADLEIDDDIEKEGAF